jgi:hypothetical protein
MLPAGTSGVLDSIEKNIELTHPDILCIVALLGRAFLHNDE